MNPIFFKRKQYPLPLFSKNKILQLSQLFLIGSETSQCMIITCVFKAISY